MWGAILGGFTILGGFLTLSAYLNGKSIKRLIREIHEDSQKASAETQKLIERISDKISEQIEKVPEKTAYLLK